jgi:hypothetical protein
MDTITFKHLLPPWWTVYFHNIPGSHGFNAFPEQTDTCFMSFLTPLMFESKHGNCKGKFNFWFSLCTFLNLCQKTSNYIFDHDQSYCWWATPTIVWQIKFSITEMMTSPFSNLMWRHSRHFGQCNKTFWMAWSLMKVIGIGWADEKCWHFCLFE